MSKQEAKKKLYLDAAVFFGGLLFAFIVLILTGGKDILGMLLPFAGAIASVCAVMQGIYHVRCYMGLTPEAPAEGPDTLKPLGPVDPASQEKPVKEEIPAAAGFCPFCGEKLLKSGGFCPGCGRKKEDQ